MPETYQALGQCLYGKVKIKAEHVSSHLNTCHCDMCRTWGDLFLYLTV